MAAKTGYLAALWKSKEVAVGGSDIHSLLTNGDFEAGALTGWIENNGGASTTTATALAGYGSASYGVVGVDDGSGAGIYQTITLTTALTSITRCVAYVWAKLTSGKTMTIKVECLSAADAVLATLTKSITSNNPFYGDAVWGYWSVYGNAPVDTKKLKLSIYSAAAQTWYIDDAGMLLAEQIAGAYQMSLNETYDVLDATTFKSATDDSGARTHILGLYSGTFSPDTVWQGAETYPEHGAGTVVFAQVFYQDGSVKDRGEFWGVMRTKTLTLDPADVEKRAFELAITSRVGEIAG
jgi:hypothetical protein